MTQLSIGDRHTVRTGPFAGMVATVRALVAGGARCDVELFGKPVEQVLPEHVLLGPGAIERLVRDVLVGLDDKLARLADAARAAGVPLNPPASEPDLAALAEVFDELPTAFLALYRTFDGCQKDDSGDAAAPLVGRAALVPAADILDLWRMWNDLDAERFAREYGEDRYWSRRWMPFLEMGDWGLGVVDLSGAFGGGRGQVITSDHQAGAERTIAFPSFDAWLATVLTRLDHGILFGGTPADHATVEARFRPRTRTDDPSGRAGSVGTPFPTSRVPTFRPPPVSPAGPKVADDRPRHANRHSRKRGAVSRRGAGAGSRSPSPSVPSPRW